MVYSAEMEFNPFDELFWDTVFLKQGNVCN